MLKAGAGVRSRSRAQQASCAHLSAPRTEPRASPALGCAHSVLSGLLSCLAGCTVQEAASVSGARERCHGASGAQGKAKIVGQRPGQVVEVDHEDVHRCQGLVDPLCDAPSGRQAGATPPAGTQRASPAQEGRQADLAGCRQSGCRRCTSTCSAWAAECPGRAAGCPRPRCAPGRGRTRC